MTRAVRVRAACIRDDNPGDVDSGHGGLLGLMRCRVRASKLQVVGVQIPVGMLSGSFPCCSVPNDWKCMSRPTYLVRAGPMSWDHGSGLATHPGLRFFIAFPATYGHAAIGTPRPRVGEGLELGSQKMLLQPESADGTKSP